MIGIVGMNNPYSSDPRYALAPFPRGCAGYRLWQMANASTGIFRQTWMNRTRRVNLCGQKWNAAEARETYVRIAPALDACSAVLLLGRKVTATARHDADWLEQVGNRIAIPHPSGLTRWYNVGQNRADVATLLAEILRLDQPAGELAEAEELDSVVAEDVWIKRALHAAK